MSDTAQLFEPDDGLKSWQKPGWQRAHMERDAALRAVESSSDPDWATEALEAVRLVALRMPEFFADDLWEAGLRGTVEDRALGPVLRRAARLGYCVRTDRVKPSVRSHLSGKTVWRSRIYDEEAK